MNFQDKIIFNNFDVIFIFLSFIFSFSFSYQHWNAKMDNLSFKNCNSFLHYIILFYKFYNDKKIIQGGQQQHVLSFVDGLALVFGCHEPESVEPKLSF